MSKSKRAGVAWVTGAAQGIGRAVAVRLAQDGFDVAAGDVSSSKDSVNQVVKEIEALGRHAVPVLADVTDSAQVADAVEDTVTELGRLDVTVANAGVAKIENFLETTPQSWDGTFAVNTRGVFLTWQAAARQYIAQGVGAS